MNPLVWKQTALDLLADIYVSASVAERELIARIVERVNRQLRDDPEAGESRSGTMRILVELPMVFDFAVDKYGVVVVLKVRWRPSRRRS